MTPIKITYMYRLYKEVKVSTGFIKLRAEGTAQGLINQ